MGGELARDVSGPISRKGSLDVGCWAEHDDGSLLLVGSTEGECVVYWLFDIAETPPIICHTALPKAEFEKVFAYKGDFLWMWQHEQTPFPWDRLMKAVNRPSWRRTRHARIGDVAGSLPFLAGSACHAGNLIGNRPQARLCSGSSVCIRPTPVAQIAPPVLRAGVSDLCFWKSPSFA
jgi:hypothetical protein